MAATPKIFIEVLEEAAELAGQANPGDEIFRQVAEALVRAFDRSIKVSVRIGWDNCFYENRQFKKTNLFESITFRSIDNQGGVLEFYSPQKISKKARYYDLLIKTSSGLLSGLASRIIAGELLHQNKERNKELRSIQQSIEILQGVIALEDSLQEICSILPDAWQYPEHTKVRISYDDKVFCSKGFISSQWKLTQEFNTPDGKKGLIEVFYTKEFPAEDEGPFLKQERALLINLANLISGSAAKGLFNNLRYLTRERLKELKGINRISKLITENKPIEETLEEVCNLLPKSWQYPKQTVVRIIYDESIYTSKKFRESKWKQAENFVTIDNSKGSIEVYYLQKFPKAYEGPFLREERELLINIARLIGAYLNNIKGREIYTGSIFLKEGSGKSGGLKPSAGKGKRLLQQFFNQKVVEKYVYLDMMKYKVKEILFVATLYDAYMMESEDSFFERFLGEIYQYSLFSLPRVTGVTSPDEALQMLDTTSFDMVILMVGVDQDTPFKLSREIKKKMPLMPIFLLLNQNRNIRYFEKIIPTVPSIDKMFIWNGDSQIFFAIVKSTEDYANVANDTQKGLVRVILLIEDSPIYYSKYLPMLYSTVFEQVQKLLPEAEKNELDKISKMRSRPKILHARNYEEATFLFNTYKDFMLCVISDAEFERNGRPDHRAGIRFIKYVKSHIFNLPIVLQSVDPVHEKSARELQVTYFNKNSESLLHDLREFLVGFLGFGDFVFRDRNGKEITRATTYSEFVEALEKVPEETYYLHAAENQFSIWLMARGEIKLAKALNPVRIEDFNSIGESRQFFINSLKAYDEQRKAAKILDFEENTELHERNMVSLASGSLGGKGRGLAFIHALIYNFNLNPYPDRINIRTPVTAIIGTDEFEHFLRRNRLYEIALGSGMPYVKLRRQFAKGRLSNSLIHKIRLLTQKINRPVTVRSSSLFEDSQSQPFAGVFDTFIVPDSPDKKEFADRLILAIKLIYASVYSESAKWYFRAIHRKVEEERMAVVIQELVGNRHGDYFYPDISGVAQSYNFYPVSHMKPEEGFSMAAVGLGTYVVDGWKSFRFSPKYPNIDMYTPQELLKTSQVKFFALDYTREEYNFLEHGEHAALTMLDISEAEKHGVLKHCASVYNINNDSLEPGVTTPGPRVVDFSNVLKYNYIPLAETIDVLLQTIKDSLGAPVEIEYAIDLNKTVNELPSFYLLQLKPLLDTQLNFEIDLSSFDRKNMLLFTSSSLGNGEVTDVQDVIFIDQGKFDKLKTYEMAREIAELNEIMITEETRYMLIGPGRWGTRDPFLGIPVNWAQISNARIIVETALADYPLDASLGSHFFHNVTSMHIGYFAVNESLKSDFIRWEMLSDLPPRRITQYFRHVRFGKPLKILMNGRQKNSAVFFN